MSLLMKEYEDEEYRALRVTDRILSISIEHGDYDVVETMHMARKAIHTMTVANKVRAWGVERDLHKASPTNQLNKIIEEVGELAAAINKQRIEEIEDAIGDVRIALTTLC